jgi:HPr kinase/phosphorylase
LIISRGQKVPREILEAAKESSTPVFRSEGVTAMIINDVTSYLNELLAPTVSMHGILLDIYGTGVMIVGESGIGKVKRHWN